MVFRGTIDINSPAVVVETTDMKTTVVSVGNEGFTIIPKSAVRGIMGFQIYITVNVSGGSPSGKVGDLLKLFKIRHGAKTHLEVNSFDQLNKVYHMLTGLSIDDVTINGEGAFTLKTPFIPFNLTLDAPNYFDFKFNAPDTVGATNLTASAYMIFYYGDAIDDHIVVLNPGVTLNKDTDINLFDYISENKVILDMWIDVGADNKLNHAKFAIGNHLVIDKLSAYDLIKLEAPILYEHLDGFFRMPVPRGTISRATGSSNKNIPKLLVNFADNVAPVIYLSLQE